MHDLMYQPTQSEFDPEPVDLQLGAEHTEVLEHSTRLSAAATSRLADAAARRESPFEASLIAGLAVVVSKCSALRELAIQRVQGNGVVSVQMRVPPEQRFDELAAHVAAALHSPATQARVVRAGDLVFRVLDGHETKDAGHASDATLVRVVAVGAELELSIRAHVSQERRHVLESLLCAYAYVLEQCSEDDRVCVRDLRLVRGDGRRLLLDTLNRTETPFQSRTIHAIFEQQAEIAPARLAVHDGKTSLTYAELNKRANRLAYALRARGVERDDICGILVDRSVDQCVAQFGILKAGGAFLPIDASYPQDRIDTMLQDSGCRFVIAHAHHFTLLRTAVELFDVHAISTGPGPDTNPAPVNDVADLAYVIYTSGSTGVPKGVPIAHEGIASFDQHYRDSFHFTREDNVLSFFSPSFDGSISELTMALLAGTGFYLLPEDVKGNYRRFEQYLNEHAITVATIPPPYLRYLDPEAFETLHTIFVAGSESTKQLLEAWTSRYSIVNHYGPTEVTICASEWKAPRERIAYGSVPIGRPIANKKVYILNEDLELQPFGVRGELCVSGVRISDGYLNQSELTAQKFIPNPFAAELPDGSQHAVLYRTGDSARWFKDGNIEFLGRIDNQVKVRGYRVELGEVEQVMLSFVGVRQATVIAKVDDSGENALYGFYAANADVSEASVRAHLASRLPGFMIPGRVLRLDVMPLTGSDKVDKKQLEALLHASQARPSVGTNVHGHEAADEVTRLVVRFIRASCETEADLSVELTDDLEALGINSLRFIKLIMQIEEQFGFEVEGEFFVGRKGLTVGDIVRETRSRVAS